MSSPSGFGLETLLEAAKFLEQQEQQKLQQQQQKQIVVVASGTSGIFESKSTGPPLLSAKVEALPGPSLNQGKKCFDLFTYYSCLEILLTVNEVPTY